MNRITTKPKGKVEDTGIYMRSAEKGFQKLEPAKQIRYCASVTASIYREHHDVRFILFHNDGLPDDEYLEIIPPELDATDPYLRSAADETFNEEEIDALREWFSTTWPPDVTFEARPAEPVRENQAGVGCMAVGGDDDFFMFCECENYPLSFNVFGYFNLSDASDGPYVRNPDLSLVHVYMPEEGKVVIKRPPF